MLNQKLIIFRDKVVPGRIHVVPGRIHYVKKSALVPGRIHDVKVEYMMLKSRPSASVTTEAKADSDHDTFYHDGSTLRWSRCIIPACRQERKTSKGRPLDGQVFYYVRRKKNVS